MKIWREEIDQHGLAAAGRPNHHRVTDIALVEAEEIGAARAGLEQRNRVAPVVILRAPRRIGVEGGEGSEIE